MKGRTRNPPIRARQALQGEAKANDGGARGAGRRGEAEPAAEQRVARTNGSSGGGFFFK